jgi:hypothetical protein
MPEWFVPANIGYPLPRILGEGLKAVGLPSGSGAHV